MSEENKQKFKENIGKYFMRRYFCPDSECGFSTDDNTWGFNKKRYRPYRNKGDFLG